MNPRLRAQIAAADEMLRRTGAELEPPTVAQRARPLPGRSVAWALTIAAALVLALGVVMVATLARAQVAPANHVLGDSLSVAEVVAAGDIITQLGEPRPWPWLLWGDAVDNQARGGWATRDFLNLCTSSGCSWLSGGPDDTWWLLIGHNYHRYNPAGDPALYLADVQAVVDLIEIHTGATDVRVLHSPHSYDVWGDQSGNRAVLDAFAQADLELCAADWRVRCVADLRPELVFPVEIGWDGVHLTLEGHEVVADLVELDIVYVPEPPMAMQWLAVSVALGAIKARKEMREKC